MDNKLTEILEVLDTVRLYIQQDGGDMEFVSYENDIVTIRLKGACIGCSMIDVTYQAGLQEILRDEVDPKIVVNLIEENPEFQI